MELFWRTTLITLIFTVLSQKIASVPMPDSSIATNETAPSSTSPYDATVTRPIRCFTPSDEHLNPTSPEACHWTKEFILKSGAPEYGPRDVQPWAHEPAPEGYHEVPDSWIVPNPPELYEVRPCRIIVSSGKAEDRDNFSLLDVAYSVEALIRLCLEPAEKLKLGGLATIGNEKGFFVAIDGYGPIAYDNASTLTS